MTLQLHAAPMSSATPVVHALAELGVDYELVPVDLSAGDQRRPEFLAMNPNGKVPTLVVDGTPMFETLAILSWLGEHYGVSRGLWPAADAPARLEAMSWTTWAYVTYGSAVGRLNQACNDRLPSELHHAGQAEQAHRELQALLRLVDARLATRAYMLGERFTLVDLVVASVITYSTFCGVPLDDHARVKAWVARFHERAAYQKVWHASAA